MTATKKMTAGSCNGKKQLHEEEIRRGPWTLDEDNLLIHYITCHGEGRWNSLAKAAGLKRTGKSCRLRWLNYLKPDVKHGNLTPQEQLLILELHSKWGNRWSKIAQHLPGRTDNEIKNYWRTKVQKQARHLKIDSNSKRFVEALRKFWLPRLLEKVEHTSSPSSSSSTSTSTMETDHQKSLTPDQPQAQQTLILDTKNSISTNCSSDSTGITFPYLPQSSLQSNSYHVDSNDFDMMSFNQSNIQDLELTDVDWMSNELIDDSIWNMDELWQFRK